MVKSPWKLLTGLLSRGKVVEQPNVGPASVTEIFNEHGGHEAQSTAVVEPLVGEPAPEPKPSAGSQADEAEAGDRRAPPPSKAADVPDTISDNGVPAPTTARDVLAIGARRRNQRTGSGRQTEGQSKRQGKVIYEDAGRATGLAGQAEPVRPDPVRALDHEILQLRSQLAAKLRLQNDQLRQMLSRFEPK